MRMVSTRKRPAAHAGLARQNAKLCAPLGRSGGYVMAPAHNMQDDVPPENIAAWVEEIGGGG